MKTLILTLSFLIVDYLDGISQKRVSIENLSGHLGKVINVCSKVYGTYVTKSKKPITFLNLGADYSKQKLTLVIFQKDLANFTFHPAEYYNLQQVCATGELKLYKERPQIIISRPEQVQITYK